MLVSKFGISKLPFSGASAVSFSWRWVHGGKIPNFWVETLETCGRAEVVFRGFLGDEIRDPWPMAKRLKLFGITCLVGKISRSNFFFFRVHWLSENMGPSYVVIVIIDHEIRIPSPSENGNGT